jgi:2-methylcitrate dehydratase PrpD
MLSAQDEPEVRAVHERLVSEGSSRQATLLRKGAPRIDARAAAFGNGLAASWNELDEGYRKAPCHAGILVLPALFAVAERDGLSVRETLCAAAVAYEIAARFARTWRSIIPPLHPHALFNSVGAAAAAGLARKLKADRLMLAITGATTMVSPGPYNHAMRGALVRNAWPAIGAQVGMQAVELALVGIGGLASSPYDVYEGCLGAQTDAAQLTADLGSDWAVCHGYHKLYACAQYSHSSLDALQDIFARRPELKGGERVAAIEVETHALGLMIDNAEPHNTLAAKFSMPHAVAAAVVYGDAGVEAFSSRSLENESIKRLRKTVSLKPHPGVKPWPLDRPGRVTLVLDSGEKLSADCASARGGPDQPFSEEEIGRKIEALSAPSAPGLPAALASLESSVERPFSEWLASIFK